MSKYVTVNIDRPADDWRKPRTWYKILAVIIATPCSLICFFAFASFGGMLAGVTGGITTWILSIKLGIKGGIIGNRFRHMIQPKSIRIKNPTPGDLFSEKIYWGLCFQFTGVVMGAVFITMLLAMFVR